MADEQRLLAGRYLVGDVIGRGGMADVYLGQDTKLGRPVAIKILRANLATDPAFRTRFRQEAQSASRMANPTIVRVFDAGEESVKRDNGEIVREPFIVMEYVKGRQLKELIAEGPLSASEAVRITDGILTALEYSHRAGVVHRDIKPGNVMITPEGDVKVMDFGIARAVSDSSSTVAQTTAILGTASYFSPEQAKGETVDARTDLYSTGVVLFEMLTGRAPFTGETAVSVAYQHVSEAPVKPSSINKNVSPALDQVVMKSLAKDRANRYQSAADFTEELEMAAAGRIPVHHKNQADAATALFGASPATNQTEQALRQLTHDDSVKRTQRRPPVVWIWAGVTVVAVIMVALLAWVIRLPPTADLPSASRTIPDVIDTTWDNAEQELKGLDLEPTKFEESSSEVKAGNVIRVDPEVGTKVDPGVEVKVYVSTGVELALVPELANMAIAKAEATLTAAKFTVGSKTNENSPTAPAGTVLRTDPASGAEVAVGTTVNIWVSTGLVTIPDVTGNTLEVATSTLEDEKLGLTVTPKGDSSCPAAPNDPVVAQSLAPGDVPQRSTIELTYCTGASEGDGG